MSDFLNAILPRMLTYAKGTGGLQRTLFDIAVPDAPRFPPVDRNAVQAHRQSHTRRPIRSAAIRGLVLDAESSPHTRRSHDQTLADLGQHGLSA